MDYREKRKEGKLIKGTQNGGREGEGQRWVGNELTKQHSKYIYICMYVCMYIFFVFFFDLEKDE